MRTSRPLQPAAHPQPVPRRFLSAALLALALAATAFGILEVHYATDTWIALAAGRQIAGSEHFPLADTFSYTVAGRPWINQNWLSHLALWRLYTWSPAATVLAIWCAAVTIFSLVAGATWIRSDSLPAALLAAALVAFGMRDHLKIRPATVQLLLVACLALALTALATQGARRRWWPIVLCAVIFAVWTHAHGSFLFGYGLLALFVALALLARWCWKDARVSLIQLAALASVAVLTAAAGVWLSPFSTENITHPFKVVESDTFREVGEWLSPLVPGKLPPVGRFWTVVGLALTMPIALILAHLATRAPAAAPGTAAGRRPVNVHLALLDVSFLLIGLGMALFARRFAPLFFILGVPPLIAWAAHVTRRFGPRVQRRGSVLLAAACSIAAVLLGYVAASRAVTDLVQPYPAGSPFTLLDRVTRNRSTPHAALEFLNANDWPQPVRLLTDWKLGGPVMFYAPRVRVFIDGRAQQVYDEAHVQHYLEMVRGRDARAIRDAVDRAAPDAILLPGWSSVRNLSAAVAQDPRWIPVLITPEARLLVQRGGPLLMEIAARERDGRLRWPDTAEAELSRGNLWLTELGDPGRAASAWQTAVHRRQLLGLNCYPQIVEALRSAGRGHEVPAYLAEQKTRAARGDGLSSSDREKLLNLLTSLGA